MKRLFSCFMAFVLALFAVSIEAQAADSSLATPPYSLSFGTDGSVSIPWTADYIVVLSGAKGSSSTGDSGGNGYTLTQTIRLQKDQVLKFDLGEIGSVQVSGQLSRGGGKSSLYVDDTLVWVAGGGVGWTPTYAYCDKTIHTSTALVIQGGEGAGATTTNGYVTYHTCDTTQPGQCYTLWTPTPGEITVTCGCHPYVQEHDWYGTCPHRKVQCDHCGSSDVPDPGYYGHPDSGAAKHSGCPSGYYAKTCGYESDGGNVVTKVDAKAGTCYYADDWEPTTASLANAGAGSFSIKLADHSNIQYSGITLNALYYLNTRCQLVILDDTVVYYKR